MRACVCLCVSVCVCVHKRVYACMRHVYVLTSALRVCLGMGVHVCSSLPVCPSLSVCLSVRLAVSVFVSVLRKARNLQHRYANMYRQEGVVLLKKTLQRLVHWKYRKICLF